MKEEKSLRVRVEKSLEKIKPILQSDGGDVELAGITTDGIVKVKLTGACHGCPMSQMTLQMSIGRTLKKEIPEVKEVISV